MEKISPAQWTFLQHLSVQSKSHDGEQALGIALLRTQTQFGDTFALGDAQAAIAHPDALAAMGPVRQEQARRMLGLRAAALGVTPTQLLGRVRAGLEQLLTTLEGRMSAPISAEAERQKALAYEPSEAEKRSLSTQLAAPRPNAKAIMDVLAANPGIAALFQEWIGTRETYSIREHSEMVHAQYLEQVHHYPLPKVPGVDLHRLFAVLPALHDIGKASAVELGDRALQHRFTMPLLEHVLHGFGFNPAEIRMAEAIVEHDVIGHLVHEKKDEMTPAGAHAELTELARSVGLSTADFFQIKSLFFIMDASAYPLLREDREGRFFTRDAAGKLAPKHPHYPELQALIAQRQA